MKLINEYQNTWQEFDIGGTKYRRNQNGYWEKEIGYDNWYEYYNPERLEKQYKDLQNLQKQNKS